MGTNAPTTPTRRRTASHLNAETPFIRKQSNRFQSTDVDISTARTANVFDVRSSIPQVPFEFFAENILPRLPANVNAASVVQSLKRSGVIDAQDRWRDFHLDPRKDSRHESEVFMSLYPVTAAIASHVNPSADALAVMYESRPHHIPICDYNKRDSKPGLEGEPAEEGNSEVIVPEDEHIGGRASEQAAPDMSSLEEGEPAKDVTTQDDAKKMKKVVDTRYWRDICTPAEFKKKDIPDILKKNVDQICWAMYQVLHEDPRRRFTFAFTIDNRDMRVWFASRSDMLVSDPFDFMQDHEKVVHFFLSQLSADEVSLGLDPTMQLISAEENKAPVYDISVHISNSETRTFRTTGLIDQGGAAGIRGRATRVWDVVEVVKNKVDGKKTGVLKDYWVDSDRKREGAILREIQAAQKHPTKFEKFFLTVLADGDVLLDNPHSRGAPSTSTSEPSSKVPDDTRFLMTNGVTPPTVQRFDVRFPDNQQADGTQAGSDPDVADSGQASDHRIISYCSKTRYRIVCQQKCKPLSHVTSLSEACTHLATTVRALRLLHTTGCGWVHRDISTGNVLIDSEGSARLADLEYAKRLDDDTSHDVRTGTAAYMAVEVDQGSYAFTKAVTAIAEEDEDEDDTGFDELFTSKNKRPQKPNVADKVRRKFRHNALHDLESVWWIFLKFLLERERSLPGEVEPEAANSIQRTPQLREYSTDLFEKYGVRMGALCGTSEDLEFTLQSLPSRLLEVGKAALELLELLVDTYRKYEAKPILVPRKACPQKVYMTFASTFLTHAEEFADNDVLLQPLDSTAEKGVKKKTRKARGTGEPTTGKRSTRLSGVAGSSSIGKRKSQTQGGSSTGKKRKSAP